MWRRPIRAAIRLFLRNRRLRSAVEWELSGRPSTTPTPAPETGSIGAFVDRHGVSHPLDPGLRTRLKPAWRTMLDPMAAAKPPSDEGLADRARTAAASVAEAETLIASVTGAPLAGRILEIGCYDGAAAYRLATDGATVVASDLARYYVVQRPGEPSDDEVRRQQQVLATLRERARVVARAPVGSVEFIEDDITASALDASSFDAIVSFEVLEHVRSPIETFAAISRLLKPGGVSFHDYNPFFSRIGGHSLCTLDFPWGHARLDDVDFERYIRGIRPGEAGPALRFYRESLNRMTLTDLRAAIEAAGLEILGVIPWFERSHVAHLEDEVFEEIRRNYPTATIEDLLANFVAVLMRKPT